MKKLIVLVISILFIPMCVNAESGYLYDVLKNEAKSNGLAREYTGEHHDSFTEEPSKSIYYWYTRNDSSMMSLKNKNNVIFGNQCWKIIRTTDTGGVKLLYYGEAVDNQCNISNVSHSSNYPGYTGYDTVTLNSNMYYSDKYIYDSSTKKYTLDTNVEKIDVNSSNHSKLIDKYTCLSSNESVTCSTLYAITSFTTETKANVLNLGTKDVRSQYGELQFNKNDNSLAFIGYMYGDVYTSSGNYASVSESFSDSINSILTKKALSTNYWYADSIDCNTETGKCSLVNPYQVSSNEDYPNLVGKYTLLSSNSTYSNTIINYISRVDGNNAYIRLLNINTYSTNFTSIIIGDSYTEDNNTYTLQNTQTISLDDWYTSHSSYVGKFICNTSSNTCDSLKYITKTTSTSYNYINVADKMLIAKSRDGLNLTNTLIVPKYELIKNSSNYQDYKYTCKSIDSTCTENNLSLISSFTTQGTFSYIPNYYYGSSVSWDGNQYTLIDTIPLENYNNLDTLKTHHYYCGNGQKKCTTVKYITYFSTNTDIYYSSIDLTNGVETIDTAINNMLLKNQKDSLIKTGLETWYKRYLSEYDDFVEDTIYCNDRRIKNIEEWGSTSSGTNQLLFEGQNNSSNNGGYFSIDLIDFSCPNITDQFSTNNTQALLKQKVGLLTTNEWNQAKMAENGNSYKLIFHMTPHNYQSTGITHNNFNMTSFGSVSSSVYGLYSNTLLNNSNILKQGGVRPVISLIPKIKYTSGTGSEEDPYIIDYVHYYGIDVEINNETEDFNIEINDLTQVEEGEEVNFRLTPIKGFKVSSLSIVDTNNTEIEYTTTDNKNFKFTMPANDVIIRPSYERVKNAVNVEDNSNTKEFIIEVNDATAVVYEDTVRFRLEPEQGYEVEKVDITDEEQNKIDYRKTNTKNEFEFTMPDTDVTISPKYRKIETNSNSLQNPNTKRNLIILLIILIPLLLITIKTRKKRLN